MYDRTHYSLKQNDIIDVGKDPRTVWYERDPSLGSRQNDVLSSVRSGSFKSTNSRPQVGCLNSSWPSVLLCQNQHERCLECVISYEVVFSRSCKHKTRTDRTIEMKYCRTNQIESRTQTTTAHKWTCENRKRSVVSHVTMRKWDTHTHTHTRAWPDKRSMPLERLSNGAFVLRGSVGS